MNDRVAEFVRARPDRFLGLCYLNPRFPEYLEPEMARCLDELGFAGFKLHIGWNGVPYDADVYTPVYRVAAERELPVLAHTWGDEAVRRLAAAARAHPTVPFLAGHSGAGDVAITIEEALRTPNLFLELAYSAGTPWVVERLVREVGAERIVWGSDSILFAQSHQIAKVAFAEISEWDKAAIFGGNARRIFGLETGLTGGRPPATPAKFSVGDRVRGVGEPKLSCQMSQCGTSMARWQVSLSRSSDIAPGPSPDRERQGLHRLRN